MNKKQMIEEYGASIANDEYIRVIKPADKITIREFLVDVVSDDSVSVSVSFPEIDMIYTAGNVSGCKGDITGYTDSDERFDAMPEYFYDRGIIETVDLRSYRVTIYATFDREPW